MKILSSDTSGGFLENQKENIPSIIRYYSFSFYYIKENLFDQGFSLQYYRDYRKQYFVTRTFSFLNVRILL